MKEATKSKQQHPTATSTKPCTYSWKAHTTTRIIENTRWGLLSDFILPTTFFENGITLDLKTILSLLEHWCKHLAEWCAQELFSLIQNVFWDTITKQEIGRSVCEVIAVVFKHMILVHTPFPLGLLKELHEQFLRDLCKSKTLLFENSKICIL